MSTSTLQHLALIVNGEKRQLQVEPTTTLAELVRDHLHLTGTKVACEEGECGACTVLVDGRAIDSCIYPALAAEGCQVETIEGLREDDILSSVVKAIANAGGVQCGFCTPGFVMMITSLLREYPEPVPELIRESLAGNICRCTGYVQIEDAVVKIVTERTRVS